MSPQGSMPNLGEIRRPLRYISGGFMALTGVIVLIGSLFVFRQFALLIAERGEDFGDIGPLTAWLIEHHWQAALPAVITIVCGALLFFTQKLSIRLPLLFVGWLSLLLAVAAVLAALIGLLAPLYTVREL